MDFIVREMSQKWFDEALPVNAKWELQAAIGTGANGTINIADGTADELAIEVVVAAENSANLAAAAANNVITVTLGTTDNGAADDTKNTATLITGAINNIEDATWEANATGTGADAIKAAVTKKDFVNVQVAFGTPCPEAGTTLYDGTNSYYYVCTKGDNTDQNNNWKKFSLAAF